MYPKRKYFQLTLLLQGQVHRHNDSYFHKFSLWHLTAFFRKVLIKVELKIVPESSNNLRFVLCVSFLFFSPDPNSLIFFASSFRRLYFFSSLLLPPHCVRPSATSSYLFSVPGVGTVTPCLTVTCPKSVCRVQDLSLKPVAYLWTTMQRLKAENEGIRM